MSDLDLFVTFLTSQLLLVEYIWCRLRLIIVSGFCFLHLKLEAARKARAKIGQFLGRQGQGNWGRANGGDRDRLGGQDGAIHTHLQEKKGCNTDTTIFSEACVARKSARKLGCFRLSAVLAWHVQP